MNLPKLCSWSSALYHLDLLTGLVDLTRESIRKYWGEHVNPVFVRSFAWAHGKNKRMLIF